ARLLEGGASVREALPHLPLDVLGNAGARALRLLPGVEQRAQLRGVVLPVHLLERSASDSLRAGDDGLASGDGLLASLATRLSDGLAVGDGLLLNGSKRVTQRGKVANDLGLSERGAQAAEGIVDVLGRQLRGLQTRMEAVDARL